MGAELELNFRLAIKEELGPIYDRLTAIETKMDEQRAAAKDAGIGPRLNKLENNFSGLNGKIAAWGAASAVMVSVFFKLIGA